MKAGRVRPLGSSGERRVPSLPEVPTLLELGFSRRFTFNGFSGLMAPARTPQPADGMSPLLADGDRVAYMGGLSYHTDRFRFDIAYEHVDTDARSTEGQSLDGFDGAYDAVSPLLHMSITLKF